MPRGTVSYEPQRYELKTLLPDGYVELKQMSYGQVVERRALMKLSVQMSGKGRNSDFKGEMAMASVQIQRFEFNHCIVDHNITDANDRKLNLSDPNDFAALDPQVGQEIEKYIGEMNNFEDVEDDPELGNSQPAV